METIRTTLRACKGRCTSQFCSDCAVAHCVKWRERLRPQVGQWESVMMLTLTIDQTKFDGPREAYEYVGKKRKISELIRKLHRDKVLITKRFTATLEFQKNGWPHWHLLVESRFVPKHDLQETWGLGNCHFSKRDFVDSSHAVNYATKYITKTSKEGDEFWFPDWVLDYPGNIRRFSTSRGLCPPDRRPARKKSTGKKRERKRRTGRQRSKC